jgi:regulation of enolase protein 1 (concanavalin A-like superfamily)
VQIGIDCSDLWFWDMEHNQITFDKGKYLFEVGSSSKDIRGTVSATMEGKFTPVIKTVVADCGAVVLRSGSTVQTNVTAAMTDDSFADLSKARIEYTSNNPGVATVDEKGTVTAKGVGVATITASVTVGENSQSGSFPVKIMPDLSPAIITVNNKAIPGFKPDMKGYSFLMKSPSNQAPLVSITPVDPAVGIDIEQAKAVPGTAVIRLTDYITVDRQEYIVNFGIRSVPDEFNATSPGSPWSWIRENKKDWSLSKIPGSLVIKGEKGDIIGATNTAENLLLQSANTDWTILTKVTFSRKPSANNEQAGLIAWQDDDNFVKLVYRANPRSFRTRSAILDMIIEENGNYFSLANFRNPDVITDDNYSLILKLERKGQNITGSYSRDGKVFTRVGAKDVVLKNAKAGIIVCNGSDVGRTNIPRMPGMQTPEPVQGDFEAAFDYFRITNSGLK